MRGRGGLEQLSSSIGWRVMSLQNFANKVAHAGLKGFYCKYASTNAS